jgi:hypothetical protein
MDHSNEFLKVSYGRERKFGFYELAPALTQVLYKWERDVEIDEFKPYKKEE